MDSLLLFMRASISTLFPQFFMTNIFQDEPKPPVPVEPPSLPEKPTTGEPGM